MNVRNIYNRVMTLLHRPTVGGEAQKVGEENDRVHHLVVAEDIGRRPRRRKLEGLREHADTVEQPQKYVGRRAEAEEAREACAPRGKPPP